MRFELIKPNKIKVMVDSSDLKKWGVSAEDVAKNTQKSRELFFHLLKEAERETGFSCNNARLVVEAAIRNGEDLTLFVTKVTSESDKALYDRITDFNQKNEKETKEKESFVNKRKITQTLVELESFEDVIHMCHAMNDYYGGSLYLYNDLYYMVMNRNFRMQASEFGTEKSEKCRYIVEEHGSLLMDNNAFSCVRSEFSE